MKITVVTACYNSAATIADTMGSVADQTHTDIEHIVVDGGSADGTLELLARHARRIARLIPGPDNGIYDALNKGVGAATGDIVGFLHSDDLYAHPRVLETVAREMSALGLDALYGDVAFVKAHDPGKTVRVYSSRRFRPSRIGWGWMPAHPALFLRKRLFERFGSFKTSYRIAGDFEYVARVFARANFPHRYLPEVLVKMRLGGVSTRGWRNTLILNREVLRACRENGISSNYLKILSKYPVKALEFLAGLGNR